MARLENVSTDDLRQVLAEVEGKAATQRLMTAINWKEEEGVRQKEIAHRYGYTQGWFSQLLTRLERLEDEPFEDVVYDEPRSGRPAKLSETEYERFVEALHESPEKADIDARAWTVALAKKYLEEQFAVEYCDRHVRRLLTEAGLSRMTASPQCSDEHAQGEDENEKRQPIWIPNRRS